MSRTRLLVLYLRQYLSYYSISITVLISIYIQTWHDGRLKDAMMLMHAHFDDLDLDARPQWVGKGKQISVACSRQLSK